jgi:hypothetical protein
VDAFVSWRLFSTNSGLGGAFERIAEWGSLNVLHQSMQIKFSEQPNVVCLLLMLWMHNSVGWWFGFRDFEAYNMELPVLFKNSYLPTQQHEEVMGTVSFQVIEFGWGWENFNWVLLSVSSILVLKSSANLLILETEVNTSVG